MSDRRQDFELLQRFTRHGEQSAFADLVRRHIDLVYATAVRKVEDHGAAEEVAQNVFNVLARKAWQFAPDDSLPAWLHRATLLECKSWVRGELGRRRREQAAAELGTTMNTSEDRAAFRSLLPLLDEALLSLREKDRTALLLRFYERHTLRDVGAAFGISDDTAQKRVQTALEKLTEFFRRRGYTTVTVATAIAALKYTTVSASAGLTSAIVSSALPSAAPVLAGVGALLARLASLTKAQTAAICLVLAAAPAAWQWQQQRGSGEEVQQLRSRLRAAQNETATVLAAVDQLRADAETLTQSLAQASAEAARADESALAFADWKQKVRAPLMAADYRWSDDSPFVRIPKAILPDLSELIQLAAFVPPGVVNPFARELLGLTAEERQVIEETLHRVAEVQRGEKADFYEIDPPPSRGKLAAREFVSEPPGKAGPEAEQRFAQMLQELRGTLGEERWPVVPAKYRSVDCAVLNRMLIPAPKATITASVVEDENGILKAKWMFTGEVSRSEETEEARNKPAGNVYSLNIVGYVNGTAALTAFLTDADSEQRGYPTNMSKTPAPEAMRRGVAAWFRREAAARPAGKGQP